MSATYSSPTNVLSDGTPSSKDWQEHSGASSNTPVIQSIAYGLSSQWWMRGILMHLAQCGRSQQGETQKEQTEAPSCGSTFQESSDMDVPQRNKRSATGWLSPTWLRPWRPSSVLPSFWQAWYLNNIVAACNQCLAYAMGDPHYSIPPPPYEDIEAWVCGRPR